MAVRTETSSHALNRQLVVAGSITGLLAQELGSADNLTVTVGPGEVFIVPQGLLHFWGNLNCKPAVLFQSYDNADPGSVVRCHTACCFCNASRG
jgi:oxalate decarboxylase/phosphoglucose isomerase-like protein (cupin superfamily)